MIHFFFLGGCALAPKQEIGEYLQPTQSREIKVAAIFVPQEKQLCGPSVLNMAAQPFKPDVSFSVYKQMTYREELKGTLKVDMISATRRLGLVPYRVPSIALMLALVEEGQPVMVFQNLAVSWLPAWHYSLLVGYHADRNLVYLHTGTSPYQELSFDRFHATWRRGGKWSYVVVPAHSIPFHAPFAEALDNAIVFENIGRPDLAKIVYSAMKQKWPDQFEPYLGLANIYYSGGKLDQAIAEMQFALERNPKHPALLANLALLNEESRQKKSVKPIKGLAHDVQ